MQEGAQGSSIPRLRRGVRLRFDAARSQPILQAPERVVVLDEIANEIVSLCDGTQDITKISRILATKFNEPPAQVEADVIGFVDELVAKALMRT
jgi:pyrroloquinoline quinone biosynthesis protein D